MSRLPGPARRRAAYVVGPLLACTLLSGCGDEPGLDTAAVEAYLVQSQDRTFGDLDVGEASCPDRTLKDGMSLPCTLAVADAEVPYKVRLRDVHAAEVRVDVALDAVVLLTDEIERFVVSTLPKDFASAQVACDHDVVVAEVGDSVDCTVSMGAQSKPVSVVVEDEQGHVSIA
jgi:hypothetical protein